MIIVIAIATFISTLLGGIVALYFKDKLHLILGFSAGAVLGVAFFDLLPESFELGKQFFDTQTITTLTALGFFIYLIVDRLIYLHTHSHEHDHEDNEEAETKRGLLGAGSLAIHSFLDGVAIGISFQISSAIGIIVATAVLVHDFSDGINTVSLVLKNQGRLRSAKIWLFIDAIAPVLGAISTMFFTLRESALGIVLALFTGFFIYIGASDLVPESHHSHPKLLTTAMTIAGAAVLYIAISIANL